MKDSDERRTGMLDVGNKIDRLIEKQEETNLLHATCSADTKARFETIQSEIRSLKADLKTVALRVGEHKSKLNGLDNQIYVSVSKELKEQAVTAGALAGKEQAKKTTTIWATAITMLGYALFKLYEYISKNS